MAVPELPKAQCNNIDYSDTGMFLSSPEWNGNDKMQYN